MYLIGTRNTATQTVDAGANVNLGGVYRRNYTKGSCGLRTFEFSANNIALQHSGIYHVTAVIVFSAPAAGTYTFQLVQNDTPLIGAIATETITTATTEFRTVTLDFYVLVDKDIILGELTTLIDTIGVINATEDDLPVTVSNIIVNVDKVR